MHWHADVRRLLDLPTHSLDAGWWLVAALWELVGNDLRGSTNYCLPAGDYRSCSRIPEKSLLGGLWSRYLQMGRYALDVWLIFVCFLGTDTIEVHCMAQIVFDIRFTHSCIKSVGIGYVFVSSLISS